MLNIIVVAICVTVFVLAADQEVIREIDGPAGSGLKIKVTKEGDCDKGKAEKGDRLEMHYTGKLASNDKVFDSSVPRGQTFGFQLGAGRVIQGWDQGLGGTCVGEKRTLYIPASMGYGARGAGALIPPNSDLIFDVELVSISSKAGPHKAEL